MERNVDKIKRLERELGRYQKKVADQAKEETKLRSRLENAIEGNLQNNAAIDAILAATALKYGEDALDPDNEAAVLGKRLVLPRFSVSEIREKYEVHARRDEGTREYVIGVVPRQELQEDAPDGT